MATLGETHPGVLAILGLIGILLQFTGVTLMGFLGYALVPQLAMPLAPIHIANGLWLIVKGFKEPHLPLPAETQRSKAATKHVL